MADLADDLLTAFSAQTQEAFSEQRTLLSFEAYLEEVTEK
jgi:hypothetical protein